MNSARFLVPFSHEIEETARNHSKRVAALKLRLGALCVAALCCATPLWADLQYSATILVGPDSAHSFQTIASAINEAGVVAGHAGGNCAGNCNVPVVWTRGVPQTLPVPAGYDFYYIRDINNRGQVLGVLRDTNGHFLTVIWTNGVPYILPVELSAQDWNNNLAYYAPDSINDSGYVLGAGRFGWLWTGSGYVYLDNLAPSTSYGFSALTNDNHFLLTSGTTDPLHPNYVAGLGGIIRTLSLPAIAPVCGGCTPPGIDFIMNNHDQVFGSVGSAARWFFWDNDGSRGEVVSPLAGFGIRYPYLNDSGQLLFTDYGGSAGHFIYVRQPNGTTEYGGEPGEVYTWAGRRGFNNRGQVLVYGGPYYGGPGYFAAVLTPYPVLTTTVFPAGAGTVSPATGPQAPGTPITVQATAQPGYIFTGFGGALGGATNPQQLTLTGDSTVYANFAPAAPKLVAQVASSSQNAGGETVGLRLRNTGAGAAANATITSITGISTLSGTGTVSVVGGLPFNAGAIAPGATSNPAPVTFSWPPSVVLVRLTVSFTANNGYTGATTLTIAR